MEKQLKCTLLLPLKDMALRRVAIFFWNDSNILASVSKFRSDNLSTEVSKKEWRENIEDKIKDKMLKLGLAKPLTNLMVDIIRPIGLEIRRWDMFHQEFLHEGFFQSEEINLLGSAKLYWTTSGKINNKRTVEELVRSDGLNLRDRYELACLYCLEDDIPLLWEGLPEEQKEYFSLDGECLPDLHFCWPYIFKGQLSKINYLFTEFGRNQTSFSQWAFEDSVIRGNRTAAEYFYQKLTPEEKEVSIMKSAHVMVADTEEIAYLAERISDVMCYLLSLMTPEQQMEIIQAHPANVLLCYFFWPWQDLFLENAGLVWTFLPPSNYGNLLQNMTQIFRSYFPKSFPEFFMHSPLSFKKYFVEPESGLIPACRFLSMFFRSEDSESIESLFRNVDAADRVKLVFHPDVFELFYKSVLRDRWHMVEVCLRETKLSETEKKRLKQAVTEFLERSGKGVCVNRKFKRLFEFLDEVDESADNFS